MSKSDGGKGSTPRPFSVDQKKYSENWDRIFKQKEQQKEQEKKPDNANV